MEEFLAIVALVNTTCGTVFLDSDTKSEKLSDIVNLVDFIGNWKSDKVHGEFFPGGKATHLRNANDIKTEVLNFSFDNLGIGGAVNATRDYF